MTTLKGRILGIIKDAGRISESLLLETFEMDDELESIPTDQIKDAISQLLNDGEIEEVGTSLPTDSPTAWVMKTYAMPNSFYRPEIRWEIGAYLSFICPWEGVRKRFCTGKWEDDGFYAEAVKKSKWVEYPIHHTIRDGKWKVKRELKTTSQMDGCNYFLVDEMDEEVYQLRQVNDQY